MGGGRTEEIRRRSRPSGRAWKEKSEGTERVAAGPRCGWARRRKGRRGRGRRDAPCACSHACSHHAAAPPLPPSTAIVRRPRAAGQGRAAMVLGGAPTRAAAQGICARTWRRGGGEGGCRNGNGLIYAPSREILRGIARVCAWCLDHRHDGAGNGPSKSPNGVKTARCRRRARGGDKVGICRPQGCVWLRGGCGRTFRGGGGSGGGERGLKDRARSRRGGRPRPPVTLDGGAGGGGGGGGARPPRPVVRSCGTPAVGATVPVALVG